MNRKAFAIFALLMLGSTLTVAVTAEPNLSAILQTVQKAIIPQDTSLVSQDTDNQPQLTNVDAATPYLEDTEYLDQIILEIPSIDKKIVTYGICGYGTNPIAQYQCILYQERSSAHIEGKLVKERKIVGYIKLHLQPTLTAEHPIPFKGEIYLSDSTKVTTSSITGSFTRRENKVIAFWTYHSNINSLVSTTDTPPAHGWFYGHQKTNTDAEISRDTNTQDVTQFPTKMTCYWGATNNPEIYGELLGTYAPHTITGKLINTKGDLLMTLTFDIAPMTHLTQKQITFTGHFTQHDESGTTTYNQGITGSLSITGQTIIGFWTVKHPTTNRAPPPMKILPSGWFFGEINL